MLNRCRLLFLTLGIGIGIILTNIIYLANPPVKHIEYSEEEIISKAKDLGMVFIKKSIDTNSNKEESNEIEVEEVKLIVEPGDTLEKISRKLYELELIDNAKNFRQYAGAKGVEKHLRAGTYIISSDLDYETITMILMKKQ
ncbi:MAG: endolytic transglycosylase MltG [Tissierellia bacterium]|nr:endolytic transglycosylase MltG [Tissierellia bacterium]